METKDTPESIDYSQFVSAAQRAATLARQMPEITRETQKLLKESSQGPPSKEQYDRMHRWYVKLKEINDGRTHAEDSRHYQDVLYAFFQNCYHLKEWIEKDKYVNPQIKIQVKDFFENSEALGLAADICNATKHFELTKKTHHPFSKKTIAPRQKISMTFGTAKPIISISYKLQLSDGTEFDAFQFASECIAEWEKFYVTRGLK